MKWGRREVYVKFAICKVKDQLERFRYRWENNSKMDINKIGSEGVGCFIGLTMSLSGRLFGMKCTLQLMSRQVP
jgi:hypothetical protein